ncbi:MAG: hypothetical protein QM724_09780 [Flavobacteriales bacterium]
MEATTAQRLRKPEQDRLAGLRAELMDIELWGLLLIGAGLFLFA